MKTGTHYPQVHHRKLVLLVLGLLLSVLPFSAWSTLESASATPAISDQQAISLAFNQIETGEQAITVTNRRHRALFDRRGVQFTPHRGPDWSWRLTYINDARQTPALPTRSTSDAVDFDRGALIERYLIKAATIEQRFVLEQPWPQDQDLVITGAIDSQGKMEPTARGWVWRDDSGVVTLGQVTVFDATGKILPAQMLVTQTHSTIQVAATDLAAATYPVTVDPEIGTNDFRISDMGPDSDVSFRALAPDVTYNAIANEYLVVWHGEDNTAPLVDEEFEIFGQRINAATGAGIGPDFRISDMGPNGNVSYGAFAPAVAFNPATNQYLVVWEGDDNTAPLVDEEKEIFGQRLNGPDGSELGVDFRISDMGPDGDTIYDAVLPDVTYNATANEFLVVWQGDDNTAPLANEEDEIFGQRLTATGTETGTNDFRISDMGPNGNVSFDASRPKVTWNLTANEFLVVWEGDDNTPPLVDEEKEIFGQRLTATGTETGTNDFRISDMGPNGDISFNAFRPDVAYNATANEYLVVWQGDDNTPPLVNFEFEIFGQRLTATGTETGTNDFRISDMGPDGDISYSAGAPRVTWNLTANEYLVVWSGDDNTAPLVDGEFEIFGQRLTATGAETGDNDFRLSDMGPDSNISYSAFTPALAWNASDNEYLVVWRGDDNTAPLVDAEFEIFGQLFNLITGGGGAPAAGGKGHEGHCSLGRKNAAFDPTLWLLLLASGAYLLRRRVRRVSKH